MFPKLLVQSIGFVLFQWLMIKLVLSLFGLSGLGDYFLFLSLLAPVFMVVAGHFKNYAVQNVYGDWPQLLRLRDQQCVLLLSICFVVGTVVGITHYSASIEPATLSVFVAVVSVKFLELMFETRQAFELRKQRLNLGVYLVLFVMLAALVVFGLWPNGEAFVGLIACLVIVSGVLRVSLREQSQQAFEPTSKLFLKVIKSVGVQAAVVALIAAVPRFSVDMILGSEWLAIFGSLIYFYLLAHILTLAIFQNNNKTLKGDETAVDQVRPLMVVTALGIVGLAMSSLVHQPLVELVFDERVAEYSHYLPWFVGFITLTSLATYMEQTLIKHGAASVLVMFNLYLFGFAVLICPALVYHWGFDGVVVYMYLLNVVKVLWLWQKTSKEVVYG